MCNDQWCTLMLTLSQKHPAGCKILSSYLQIIISKMQSAVFPSEGKYVTFWINIKCRDSLDVFKIVFVYFLDCKDKNINCSHWKSEGYCRHSYVKYMAKNCPKSCNKCWYKVNWWKTFHTHKNSTITLNTQRSITVGDNVSKYMETIYEGMNLKYIYIYWKGSAHF